MNKEQPKQFTFLYPIMDISKPPAKHLTDLSISGTVDIGRLRETLSISIKKINHIARGESYASDIKEFLKCTNPDLHKEIESAALTYATDMYELKPQVIV